MVYRVVNDAIVGSVLLQFGSIMNVFSFDCLAVHFLSDNWM